MIKLKITLPNGMWKTSLNLAWKTSTVQNNSNKISTAVSTTNRTATECGGGGSSGQPWQFHSRQRHDDDGHVADEQLRPRHQRGLPGHWHQDHRRDIQWQSWTFLLQRPSTAPGLVHQDWQEAGGRVQLRGGDVLLQPRGGHVAISGADPGLFIRTVISGQYRIPASHQCTTNALEGRFEWN